MAVAVRSGAAGRPEADAPALVVCLAGNPNVGKSSLFNALTGAAAETAHCAGVTTEASAVSVEWRGRRVEVVDLPGTYSLGGDQGADQRAARAALLARRPDVVVAVADATNLARSLYLPLQLIDLGFRVVVAVNLADEARRRERPVDTAALAEALGLPVVATVAPRGEGVPDLESSVLAIMNPPARRRRSGGTPLPAAVDERVAALAAEIAALGGDPSRPACGLAPRAAALAVLEGDTGIATAVGLDAASGLTLSDDALALTIAQARHAEARRLAAIAQSPAPRAGDTLWRIATTPRTGIPLLSGVITAMFATLFVVGDLLARLLTGVWTAAVSPAVTSLTIGLFGDGVFGRTVLWGVDGGILATLAVGIPYILTFYFILALVEDSGYMNAAAFLSDRVMHRVGLHGRAVIPLISAGGCNVPAIIATRSLTTMRERVIASTLATLMPCSARTAVIIGAVAGVAGWQYALLTYGVIFVVIVLAGLGLNRLLPGAESAFVMEMFPFRRPVLRQVAGKTWRRFREFVWDAAPIIIIGSMALGLLYETGVVWRLTEPLAPIVEGWLLLPAVAGLTLIFAVLRKELALQLLLVFAAVSAGGAVAGIGSFMTTPQIVTFAIVNAIYIPCLATISVLGREIGWRRTALVCVGTMLLALLVGGIVAHGLPLLGV